MVAVKSPGHTPGHLLFYIRTAGGREILYVGDLVRSARNLESGRSRPRIVSQYFLHEDAAAVADQLRALITFAELHPEVEIVVSHDADLLERQIDLGVVEEGLKPEQPGRHGPCDQCPSTAPMSQYMPRKRGTPRWSNGSQAKPPLPVLCGRVAEWSEARECQRKVEMS